MNRRTPLILALALGVFILTGFSQEENPDVIAIQGASIFPVVGPNISSGTLVMKNGHIEAIGADINIPAGAKIIDGKGLYAFPGMIDGASYLGLQEISGVSATVDLSETGRINPQVYSLEAVRPDSVHIPITRSNGITTALVVPTGGLVAGKSALIRMVGYTPDELGFKGPVAMHIEFPSGRRSRRQDSSASSQASTMIQELKDLFHKARYYQKRKEAAEKDIQLPLPEFDETLENLLPVVNGELPVMISVNAENDILSAIQFVKEENLKAIFYGVAYGWKVPDQIKESGIPVIFSSLYGTPSTWDEGYDALYRNPAVLSQAGVKIAFSSQSASVAKDLPYHAAKAAAFGLDKQEALKAVTIYPAEIFGVADELGSLEVGKLANVVLADGDILELGTNITHVFIEGKEMDMSSLYTELLEKFKKRH